MMDRTDIMDIAEIACAFDGYARNGKATIRNPKPEIRNHGALPASRSTFPTHVDTPNARG